MRTTEISITLTELQEALGDYAAKHINVQPLTVVITGFGDKPLLLVPLQLGETIEGKSFRQVAE